MPKQKAKKSHQPQNESKISIGRERGYAPALNVPIGWDDVATTSSLVRDQTYFWCFWRQCAGLTLGNDLALDFDEERVS